MPGDVLFVVYTKPVMVGTKRDGMEVIHPPVAVLVYVMDVRRRLNAEFV